MVLTSSNLAHYLLARGLLTPVSIVDGDYLAVETARRNRNFKVIRSRNPAYFVKQVKIWDNQSLATLRCEVYCYWLAANHPDFAALRSLVPRFYGWDENHAILVTELLTRAENLSEYHARHSAFPIAAAMELGSAFGRYHRQVPAPPPDATQAAPFPRRVPWALTMHQPEWKTLTGLSEANAQMIALVHSYPEFAQALEPLRAAWPATALIHGDIKWDNCMVETDSAGNPAIKIVDWEMADWGDGLWDVAAIFNQYLSHWIYSLPGDSSAATVDLVDSATRPFRHMLPALHAFWSAYARASELSGLAAKAALSKTMTYCGARMLQSVYEYSQYSPRLTRPALYLLQASQNILADPEGAVRDLLEMGNTA
ncbi:MAG TPA: phosphotransferase [Acidisarcina sp.]